MQSSSTPVLSIGTRGSPLALFQAHLVRARLAAAHGIDENDIAVVTVSTAGDRSQSTTGRCPISAARACFPRRSRSACSPATSISACIRPRTWRRACPTDW